MATVAPLEVVVVDVVAIVAPAGASLGVVGAQREGVGLSLRRARLTKRPQKRPASNHDYLRKSLFSQQIHFLQQCKCVQRINSDRPTHLMGCLDEEAFLHRRFISNDFLSAAVQLCPSKLIAMAPMVSCDVSRRKTF